MWHGTPPVGAKWILAQFTIIVLERDERLDININEFACVKLLWFNICGFKSTLNIFLWQYHLEMQNYVLDYVWRKKPGTIIFVFRIKKKYFQTKEKSWILINVCCYSFWKLWYTFWKWYNSYTTLKGKYRNFDGIVGIGPTESCQNNNIWKMSATWHFRFIVENVSGFYILCRWLTFIGEVWISNFKYPWLPTTTKYPWLLTTGPFYSNTITCHSSGHWSLQSNIACPFGQRKHDCYYMDIFEVKLTL